MAGNRKLPHECTTTQIKLCGEVKEKVLERQRKELIEKKRYISIPDAVNKLILGK
jgi:hypothetical protein